MYKPRFLKPISAVKYYVICKQVVPYSITNVGPGADAGFLAVNCS